MVAINSDRLRRELSRRGLDQATLARRTGCTEATISNGLHRGSFRRDTLVKIAEALDRSPVLASIEAVMADGPPDRNAQSGVAAPGGAVVASDRAVSITGGNSGDRSP